MGKIKKNQIRVSFIGGNAEDVTGSMTLVESKDFKILLECGLVQSNNIKSDYYANSRKFPFKPKEIDYIFLGHVHADHVLLIPRLVAEGFRGKIIVPIGTTKFFKIMALDSAYIMSKDVEFLRNKYRLNFSPIYNDCDVADSIPLFEEYNLHEKIELNEFISFRFVPSGHIISACQLEIWLKSGGQTKKILMTSDLGNIACDKHYITPFEPVDKSNLAIVETTYSDTIRSISKKDRIKDLKKIESIVREVCIENKNKVLIPIFSLDRCQNILTHLYNIFKNNKNFSIPILVDSPLAQKMCDIYSEVLTGDELELWKNIMSWNLVKFPKEYSDSKVYMDSKEPCVVLAASGFMTAGRSRQWAKSLLPNAKSHIIFVGFSSENALASKIKYGGFKKTITIDRKQYLNKCGITDLHSFSGHMQRSDMLNYYSNIDCEKVALVHGDFKSKCEFAKDLQEEISRKNKSSRVICVNKSTEIIL